MDIQRIGVRRIAADNGNRQICSAEQADKISQISSCHDPSVRETCTSGYFRYLFLFRFSISFAKNQNRHLHVAERPHEQSAKKAMYKTGKR